MKTSPLEKYMRQGFFIFRQIVPPTLLRDLREQVEIARDLAHSVIGPQTQRLQPLELYADRLDLQPFREYIDHPKICDAVAQVFGGGYSHGKLDTMGLLVEPVNHPYHLGWHRDYIAQLPPEEREETIKEMFEAIWNDLRFFNQVNCALYPDSCTWFVPGSHRRHHDLPGEHQTTGDRRLRRPPKGMSNTEAEQHFIAHCRQMPGAVQIHLEPGDMMVYRNLGWHTGNYQTQPPRATIHDFVYHPDWPAWKETWHRTKQASIDRYAARREPRINRMLKWARFPMRVMRAVRNRVSQTTTHES